LLCGLFFENEVDRRDVAINDTSREGKKRRAWLS